MPYMSGNWIVLLFPVIVRGYQVSQGTQSLIWVRHRDALLEYTQDSLDGVHLRVYKISRLQVAGMHTPAAIHTHE